MPIKRDSQGRAQVVNCWPSKPINIPAQPVLNRGHLECVVLESDGNLVLHPLTSMTHSDMSLSLRRAGFVAFDIVTLGLNRS